MCLSTFVSTMTENTATHESDGILPKKACLLAPMVRCGTLPLRLQALRNGADLVYTEELIDKQLAECVRMDNKQAGTVDFYNRDGAPILRTTTEETKKLGLQLGTASPALAVQAVKMVRNFITLVDINCGCPKHFSIQAGMGAALLKKPELLCDIIRALKHECDIPVSCKIRLLDTTEETIDLMRRVEQAGVCFISIHLRSIEERPKDPAHWEKMTELVEAVNVPVVANGDVWNTSDVEDIQKRTGCSGVMLARGALYDCSIFRVHRSGNTEDGKSMEENVRDYLRTAAEVGNTHANTKYTVSSILKEHRMLSSEVGIHVQRAKTPTELAAAFNVKSEVSERLKAIGVDPDVGKLTKKQRNQHRQRIIDLIKKKVEEEERSVHVVRNGEKVSGPSETNREKNRKRKNFDVQQALGIKHSKVSHDGNDNTSSRELAAAPDAPLNRKYDDDYFLQFMDEDSRRKVKCRDMDTHQT
eukprot:gb/GECG01015119.1/.p1 GENE.gb/GECG01015119.1/~~gb/GECG01015119.1/.p1  ORF type:complete len:473 (+),score=69.81 gb/GECG01015119.1/:1-1419(+)